MAPVTRSRAKSKKNGKGGKTRVAATPAPERAPCPSLPLDVMERIADLATPMTILNLQLANKEWASACRGKLQKYADLSVDELSDATLDEAIDLFEKRDWKTGIDFEQIWFYRHVECFQFETRVHVDRDRVCEVGATPKRARDLIRRAWDRYGREKVEESIVQNLVYSMARVPKERDFAKRFLLSIDYFGGWYHKSDNFAMITWSGLFHIDETFDSSVSPRLAWRKFFERNASRLEEHFAANKNARSPDVFEREIAKMKFSLR
jgi:hypothetical protein